MHKSIYLGVGDATFRVVVFKRTVEQVVHEDSRQ